VLDEVNGRINALKTADPDNIKPIPIDLVTSSASGLDPHISIAAAEYQISRIARCRDLSKESVRTIVKLHTYGRFLGLLGEPVVNVLEVNLALDGQKINSERNK
jgi:K+-transporting ATPase ATPase C chain